MKKLICLFLVVLSFTNLGFFKIGSAVFTLFHALFPIVLFFLLFIGVAKKRLVIKKPPLYFMSAVYICVINLMYYDSIKHSSFVFSLIILSELLLIYNCVKKLDITDIKWIVKAIILIYFINISITSVLIWTQHYPQGFLSKIFAIYFFDGRIRPFGFSSEPSYAAITIVFSLYLLLKSDNFTYQKSEMKWYVMAMITVLLTGSAYGYLFLALVLIYFLITSGVFIQKLSLIIKSNVLSKRELILVPIIALILIIAALNRADFSKNKSIKRLTTLYTALTTSDEGLSETLKHTAYVDGSASMRITPTLHLIDDFKQSDLKYVLFGRGAGQSVPFFSSKYNVNAGDSLVIVLGFIPSFVYNYGLIGALLFLCFFFYMFPKRKLMLVILFLLMLPNADFNTQLFLFILFSVMAAKHIEEIQQQQVKYLTHEKN
ncbi:MAG: hypothetical protein KF900_11040 [Bacteroidetes bacterium]|nr:hypothetical protein [Bacteroidota bacterium]